MPFQSIFIFTDFWGKADDLCNSHSYLLNLWYATQFDLIYPDNLFCKFTFEVPIVTFLPPTITRLSNDPQAFLGWERSFRGKRRPQHLWQTYSTSCFFRLSVRILVRASKLQHIYKRNREDTWTDEHTWIQQWGVVRTKGEMDHSLLQSRQPAQPVNALLTYYTDF